MKLLYFWMKAFTQQQPEAPQLTHRQVPLQPRQGCSTHCSQCCPSTGAPLFIWWMLHSLLPQMKSISFSTNYPLIANSRGKKKKVFQWKSVQLSSLKYCTSLCSLIPITDRNIRNTQECKAAQDLVGMTAVSLHLLWPIGELTTTRRAAFWVLLQHSEEKLCLQQAGSSTDLAQALVAAGFVQAQRSEGTLKAHTSREWHLKS